MYSDWDTNPYVPADGNASEENWIQPTLSDKTMLQLLEYKRQNLQLHIQEVSGFVIDSQGKGRSIRLQADYLPGLIKQKDLLEARIREHVQSASMRRSLANRFGVARFKRGGGP